MTSGALGESSIVTVLLNTTTATEGTGGVFYLSGK
jgi:hypothetical protein